MLQAVVQFPWPDHSRRLNSGPLFLVERNVHFARGSYFARLERAIPPQHEVPSPDGPADAGHIEDVS